MVKTRRTGREVDAGSEKYSDFYNDNKEESDQDDQDDHDDVVKMKFNSQNSSSG